MRAILIAFLLFQASDYSAEGAKALEEGRYQAAVEAFTQAVAADAGDPYAHFGLGLALGQGKGQLADLRVQEEMVKYDQYARIWQSFAVLLPIKSVGIMGDQRTYENVIVIRAVTSEDAMTADWAKLPHDLLGRISSRIINEVRGVNRVVYDISSKPPSTIEWE